jgi:uncharacterized membrane protein YfcA
VDPGPLRDALTVAVGVATGGMSGLFGIGGAVISTPGIRALGAPAHTAIGTTLPCIIPGAASGTLRYAREGLVDGPAVRATTPVGIVAAVAGALLTEVVPGQGHALMLATAALLAVSGARMIRNPSPDGAARPPDVSSAGVVARAADPAGKTDGVPGDLVVGAADRTHGRPTAIRLAAVGTLAGLLSGLLGIGGGTVMVPGFTQVAGLPLKRAIATSLACVGIFAVPGTITHALLGNIDWRFALLLTVGMIPGARLGAGLAIRAEDRRLHVVVGAFLAVTAVVYAAGEIASLGS